MAKFHGVIGFILTAETAPGVFTEVATERSYFGDILRNTIRFDNGEKVNDNLNVSNKISIIANQFLYENLPAMKYVKWMGSSWKITTFDIERPRLILTIGGVYNAA